MLLYSLLAAANPTYTRYSFFLATVGHYSLFPLLFTPTGIYLLSILYTPPTLPNFFSEYPIKVLLFLLHTLFQVIFLKPKLTLLEKVYLWGLLPLEIFASFIHPTFILPKLPFLPLMAISVYCSVGVIYTFLCLYWNFFLKPKAHIH
jgi:alpha-1,3-glucosyltransferase